MGIRRTETPFPTGLFKSEGFLRKVEAAMRSGRCRKVVRLVKPNGVQVVTIVDARTGKVVAKEVVGKKACGGMEVVSAAHIAVPKKRHAFPMRAKTLSEAIRAGKGYRAGWKSRKGTKS